VPDTGEADSQLPPRNVWTAAWNATLPPPELLAEMSSVLAVEFSG
jgi:hypothetical protein